jgi:hypothetical protein
MGPSASPATSDSTPARRRDTSLHRHQHGFAAREKFAGDAGKPSPRRSTGAGPEPARGIPRERGTDGAEDHAGLHMPFQRLLSRRRAMSWLSACEEERTERVGLAPASPLTAAWPGTRQNSGAMARDILLTNKPIEGVATSIAAFVGITPGGPADTPVRVRNWAQFAKLYGDPEEPGHEPYADDPFLAHAVRGFFDNGGTCC